MLILFKSVQIYERKTTVLWANVTPAMQSSKYLTRKFWHWTQLAMDTVMLQGRRGKTGRKHSQKPSMTLPQTVRGSKFSTHQRNCKSIAPSWVLLQIVEEQLEDRALSTGLCTSSQLLRCGVCGHSRKNVSVWSCFIKLLFTSISSHCRILIFLLSGFLLHPSNTYHPFEKLLLYYAKAVETWFIDIKDLGPTEIPDGHRQ